MNKMIILSRFMLFLISISPLMGFCQTKTNSDSTSRSRIYFYPAEILPAADKDQALTISPNPANSLIKLQLNVPDASGFMLELYDSLGLRLLYRQWKGDSLDVSPYPPGVYLLTLRREKETYTQKLLIER